MMQCIDKYEEYYKYKMFSDLEDEDDDFFVISDDQGEEEVFILYIDVSSSIVIQNFILDSISSQFRFIFFWLVFCKCVI